MEEGSLFRFAMEYVKRIPRRKGVTRQPRARSAQWGRAVAPEGGKLAREGEGHVHQRASRAEKRGLLRSDVYSWMDTVVGVII